MNSKKMMHNSKDIKLVATDIDGVWTNSCMYYTSDGEVMKAFSTYDGMAVELLRNIGIPTIIMTSENSEIVIKRAEKLLIDDVYIGEKEKLPRLRRICDAKNVSLDEVAYIGDDINDLDVLKSVGISAIPINSPIKDKFIPDFITSRKGGEGAFREFVDELIKCR